MSPETRVTDLGRGGKQDKEERRKSAKFSENGTKLSMFTRFMNVLKNTKYPREPNFLADWWDETDDEDRKNKSLNESKYFFAV